MAVELYGQARSTTLVSPLHASALTMRRRRLYEVHGGGGEDHGGGGVHLYSLPDRRTMTLAMVYSSTTPTSARCTTTGWKKTERHWGGGRWWRRGRRWLDPEAARSGTTKSGGSDSWIQPGRLQNTSVAQVHVATKREHVKVVHDARGEKEDQI